MRTCQGTTKTGSRCGNWATHCLPDESKTTRCFHHQKQSVSFDETNIAKSSQAQRAPNASSSRRNPAHQDVCLPAFGHQPDHRSTMPTESQNVTAPSVTLVAKNSSKETVDTNTAAAPQTSITPSRQRKPPSRLIPDFEALDLIDGPSGIKVAKRKAPPHIGEDYFKKGKYPLSQKGPRTANKEPNTGYAELDAGIPEPIRSLDDTEPSELQATKQLPARAQHDSPSDQQRRNRPQSSTPTQHGPVKAPHTEEPSTNIDAREVLTQLGQMLRPYIFTPDKSQLLADNNTYANLSIDDEISNSLDNIAGSFTAEAFLADAKVLKKLVKHYTSVLKEQGSFVSRHGKRIAITEGQIDILTARLDVLEQQQKEGKTKEHGIIIG